MPILCPSPHVGGCYIHPLSDIVSINESALARVGQCLDRTRMDGCSGSPNEMNDTRAHSRWHDRASYDGRRHLKTRDGIKTYGPVDGDRDDKIRCDVALRDLGPSRGKVEPNDLA